MSKGTILASVGMVAVLGAAFSGPVREPQQTQLKTQVAKLRREVAALKAVMGLQEKRIAQMGKQTRVLSTWFHALPSKLKTLTHGLNEAGNLGFTAAGANPQAKQAMLDAVRKFSHDLAQDIPKPQLQGR